MPWYLNASYLIVGAILIGLAITIIVFKFKKVFNGWFGIFAILVSCYTLFLVIKIYLSMTSTKPEAIGSIWAYIAMIVPDLLIIFYTLSTLMGSKAELLSKRLKRFGLDSVIIWLILSKVTYEFIHYFPYQMLSGIPIPWIQWISGISLNDIINAIKNIAVLIFFVFLLIVIGIYEIRKFYKEHRKLQEEVELEVKEIFPSAPAIEEPDQIIEGAVEIKDSDTNISEEEDTNDTLNNKSGEDFTY